MPEGYEVVIGESCWICNDCNRVWPEEITECTICGMLSGKCVECGTLLSMEELKHIWMEYDPDFLEEGDETEVYIGLMCENCITAAVEPTQIPIVHLAPEDFEDGDEEDIS